MTQIGNMGSADAAATGWRTAVREMRGMSELLETLSFRWEI